MRTLIPAICLSLLSLVAQAAALPAPIVARGTIIAAIVPDYPPLDLRDPATNALTGFDVDLGDALAAKLGVKMQWQETSFDQMIAAVDTGCVDIILSGMSDLASRHKVVSFVDYLKSGPQFYVLASRKSDFPDMAALCGHTVGASRRTSFPREIAAWSVAHCEAAGHSAIKVVGTDGSADAQLQVREGRIDAGMQGSETLPYIMSQRPNLYAPVGTPIATQLTGIGVAKSDTALQTALADALKELLADGTYAKLLAKWQLYPDAIGEVTINDGK